MLRESYPPKVQSSCTFCWPLSRFRGILAVAPALPRDAAPDSTMSTLNTIAKKPDQALLGESLKRVPEDPKQRRLMVGSLCLLLLALGVVLWHDRDFWFPDAPDAESDQPVESVPAKQAPLPSAVAAKPVT